jgi:hypothetical protein
MSDAPSQDPREGGAGAEPSDAEAAQRPPATPFDNPWFLPVVLLGLALWFGWDGWFNQEMEWIKFNRYGFVFLLGAAGYFTLTELSPRPYLLAMLYAAYAVWLGAMGFLGRTGADVWYADSAAAIAFNRYGAALFAVLAGASALRERRRRSARSTSE